LIQGNGNAVVGGVNTVRKAVLILLFLSLAAFGSTTLMFHPWEHDYWKEQNPDMQQISGKWVWENPDAADATLSSLGLESIQEGLGAREAGLIMGARDARANATDLREKCDAELEYAKDYAATNGLLEKSWAAALPVPPLLIPAIVASWWASENDKTHADDLVEYCSGYGLAWEAAMSGSVDALGLSMDKAFANYSAAERAYADAEQAGMCDPDYTGAGHQECLDVQTAFGMIDSGSTEGSYGIYNIVQTNLDGIREESGKRLPDMSEYSITMNLIWRGDGVLAMLQVLRAKANESECSADESFASSKNEADGRRNGINGIRAYLQGNDLERITSAYTIPGTVGGSATGTIADRYAEKEEELQNAASLYDSAGLARKDSSRRGFLKDAINRMSAASTDYESLEISLPMLRDDARQVVSGERDEAAARIAEAQGLAGSAPASKSVRDEIGSSITSFSKGENATSLGKKFGYHSEAAAAAREAITDFNTRSFNESIGLEALKKELGGMIAKAAADGLSTYSEQEVLKSVGDSDYSWAEGALANAENEIVGMAQLRYGGLETKRTELLKKIALVGGDADDQLTEMANAEHGMVGADGKIDYRTGLGKLKALEDKYNSIEKTVDSYMQGIVQHSITVDSEAMVDEVGLDAPSKITMDFLVINTGQYGAQNVKRDVLLPIPAPLMYSDIILGAEAVSSITMDGKDTMTLYLKKVDPYAKQRIEFETSETLAHTTKTSRSAIGLGDGSASVDDEVDFTLDSAVNSLTIPAGMENVMIDGRAPGIPLAKGKHHLSSSYVAADAYNESASNVRAGSLGLNSQVDYDIVLDPNMDLDSAVVFIDPGAKISNLNVFTLSGESVGKQNKISDARYSCEVSGLKAGKEASIRVSYVLENSSEYIAQELAVIGTANYSGNVTSLVEAARSAFNSGDANAALASLQQAQAQMKKEDAERGKNAAKAASLRQDIQAELDEINSALADAPATNSSFVAKLSARAAELDMRLSGTTSAQPEDALRELEAVDPNWKDNEVKTFRKDTFDQYNKLKLRFAAAGNASTPDEFLAVESDLNKLEASGRLGYAMSLASDMEKAEALVKNQEGTAAAARTDMKSSYGTMKDSIRAALVSYKSEAAFAKGTELSPIFTISGTDVESKITELDKLIQNGDPGTIRAKMDALGKAGDEVSGTMDLLRTQSLAKLDLAGKMLNESRGGMAQADQDAAGQKIEGMRNFIAAGQYVNAVKAGNTVLTDIQNAKKDNGNSLLLLGITALAILAVVATYILKQRGERKTAPGKALKRLGRAEDGEKAGPEAEEREPPNEGL